MILGDVPAGTSAAAAAAACVCWRWSTTSACAAWCRANWPRASASCSRSRPPRLRPSCSPPTSWARSWRDGRVHLPVSCFRNDQLLGQCHAGEMFFSFYDLVAHVARTRPLTAGTILGSGTISNEDASRGVSCLVEARMRETLATGAASTQLPAPRRPDPHRGTRRIRALSVWPHRAGGPRAMSSEAGPAGAAAPRQLAPLGIRKIAALVYYVHDLARVRAFMLGKLDFAEIGESGADLVARGRQASAVFRAGDVNLVVCAPVGEGGRAWRYLRKHPEGVGTVVFEVDEIDRTFALLEERGGTMITDIERFADDSGTLGDVLDDHAVRRHHLSFHRTARLPELLSRHGHARQPARWQQRVSLQTHRSPDHELPDHEPGAAVDGTRDGHAALLVGAVPHPRRGARPGRRLGPALGGHDGTAVDT